MPMVTLRVTDDEKEAWVEQAGGARRLSEWIRARCNGTLAERGEDGVVAENRGTNGEARRPVGEGDSRTPILDTPRSARVPERPFHPDFKKPKAEAKKRRY